MPFNGSIATYGAVGDAIVIGGVAVNKGTNNIASFTVKYKYGTGAIVSETKSIKLLPYSESDFVFTTPVTLSGTASTPLKIWVEYPGDAVSANDTQTVWLATYTTKPKKNVFIEEGTGLWCSWCVRGIIYMDSIHKAFPNTTNIVTVHNFDPMMIDEYNDLLE